MQKKKPSKHLCRVCQWVCWRLPRRLWLSQLSLTFSCHSSSFFCDHFSSLIFNSTPDSDRHLCVWLNCVCVFLLNLVFSSQSQICCLKGQRGLSSQPTFDGIHIINHYVEDVGSYQSSDEDGVKGHALQDGQQRSGGGRVRLRPNLRDTDSEEEEEEEDEDDNHEALRLSVPQSGSHKSTTV